MNKTKGCLIANFATVPAELVNAQFRHPFAGHWGDGTTSSSDGQNFRTASKAKSTGHINPKYGSSPGRTFYTHISDQYAPFHTKVVGTVAKLAMRQPFVLFKGLTFQKLCLPGAFRPGDHHNKMLRPGLCVVHASPQYL
ncbi:hypothetical protein ETE46_00105 [Escherichia coli]|nr:hypothetical protein ETE46_00105 [Escherichia coli]